MHARLQDLLTTTKNSAQLYKPSFYNLNVAAERASFLAIIAMDVFVTDDVVDQLKELIRSRNPSVAFDDKSYNSAVRKHLNGMDPDFYGVWVFYPWSLRLVHLLPENEFVELRTSRNKYKITDQEELILSKKIVGVVGLSVGQSVSLALSMERGCGELRIADFDLLELTNLNRIRSGVHNLGLLKTIIVAREIAEIDPFLKVTPFIEGLTKNNMDEFFTGGGKMDLIIDECDGLDMKIYLREKAKTLGIPVLMEASDRGTLDVERYDLEPTRPFLHGFIDHLDASKIGSLTNEEKIPFLLPMLGAETISTRLKASMLEVSNSITTWPQLASAVALGGAITADVCRRILLDQFHDSGRYFVDIETLVNNNPRKKEGVYPYINLTAEPLSLDQMKDIAEAIVTKDTLISANDMRKLAAAGAAAPSAGNNQPWKFLSLNSSLFIFHDEQKALSWFNTSHFISYISLGAVVENIAIEASALNLIAAIDIAPLGSKSPLIAVITYKPLTSAAGKLPELASFIGSRCTNRKKGSAAPLVEGILDGFNFLLRESEGSALSFVEDKNSIEQIANIVGVAERIRFLHPQTHHEFFKDELKWGNPDGQDIAIGLDYKTLELTEAETIGLQVASNPDVIATLNLWEEGKGFEKLSNKSIRSSGAIGVITVSSEKMEDVLNGGRLLERIWLYATMHNLALHPISAPLFLYNKITTDSRHGLNNSNVTEIYSFYSHLCSIFPALSNQSGIFLFRLSAADAPSARSLRQPLEEIYFEI